ncbi:NfeD family protein [Rhodoferax sp.]|uniref:NfeD family protein n=1 Tax=Rhodoferax sp. TaxID=50421 RepID=UPI0027431ED8|nr:NfeD family protein [Rhodoferax sp.]
MAMTTVWWILAGVAVALELLSGTFYLLMLALGLAAGALAAQAGLSSTVQFVVAAAVGGGAVVAWRAYRLRQPSPSPASANRDVNMDVGETVQVTAWNADGTANVKYRGAQWSAAHVPETGDPVPGPHRIVEVVGSRLIVEKLPS